MRAAEERRNEAWDHTASLLCKIHNFLGGHARPSQFHPAGSRRNEASDHEVSPREFVQILAHSLGAKRVN